MGRSRRGAALVLLAPLAAASGPGVRAQAPRAPVVRISLEVVQVDAVVTDGTGRHVTDLQAGDFTVRVRNLLNRFVDEQMEAGDLVAIVRTGAGLGSLQQFTSDRRLLRTVIERVRFNLAGRGPLVSAFALAGPAAPVAVAGGAGGAALAAFATRVAASDRRTTQARQAMLATGTLGALRYVMKGLAQLPGRKSVLMLSEGFALDEEGRTSSQRDFSGIYAAIQATVEEANHASVVVYAIDPQGLLTLRSDASGRPAQSLQSRLEPQGGLSALAEETGGLLLANTNDLAGSLVRVLEDQTGYYLLGYVPEPKSFESEGGRPRYTNCGFA